MFSLLYTMTMKKLGIMFSFRFAMILSICTMRREEVHLDKIEKNGITEQDTWCLWKHGNMVKAVIEQIIM